MPIKVKVREQKLGAFLKLRCVISISGSNTEEITITTENYVVNDLATIQLLFKDNGDQEHTECRILAKPCDDTEHCKVKVTVSFQEEDTRGFYSQWICTNEWKVIGKTSIYDVELENVFTTVWDINITAYKVEETFPVKLYKDVDFTDFNLSGAEGSVAVHRAVLAAQSDVFRTMLSREWKDTTEGRIQVKEVTQKDLQHFKEYMYLRTLPYNDLEVLESLLLLAVYYFMEELKAECVSALTLKCTPENWSSLLDFAADSKIPELMSGLVLATPVLGIKKRKV